MRTGLPGCTFSGLALLALSFAPGADHLYGQGIITAEAQAYPAGLVGRVGAGVSGAEWSFALLGGYNATDRRDWGEHEDEQGGGPGLGVRVIRGPDGEKRGLSGEVRLDLWFLDVDWTDARGTRQGRSSLRVVQPGAGVGYQWNLAGTLLRLGVALGWELNTGLEGEPVGEGPVLLGGIQVDFGRGFARP